MCANIQQRDQEYRESVANTLRTHRSESTRQTIALERLHARNEDLARQMSLAQSQERSARAALRTAESSARSLREEMLRLKTTVQQVRTSCANDVRKRDVQIQKLKGHLTGQQRGNKTGLVGASITINPGSIGVGGATSSIRDDSPDLNDPSYSLKQETTEFLTQLSQSLSDENDNLIGLVRSTLLTLKELQGMPERNGGEDEEGLSVIGEEGESTREGMFQVLPTNYETLASDMETVLDNLKNLLTNPNFVAVDEVEMREEEILRLRAGWEKMEARLREAFMLMDSWRQRMNNGDTINLEEIKMGLDLGMGLETAGSDEMSVVEEENEEDEVADDASSVFDEQLEEVEGPEEAEELDDVEEPEESEEQSEITSPTPNPVPERTTNSDMFKLKLQPKLTTALRETNGNKSPSRSPRKVAFESLQNTPSQLEVENAADASGIDLVDVSGMDAMDAEKSSVPASPSKAPRSGERITRSATKDDRAPRHVRCDKLAGQIIKMASKVTFSSSSSSQNFDSPTTTKSNTHQTRKRNSSPRPHPDEPSPKLTVHDKLAQAEADAAAAAESLKVVSKSDPDDSITLPAEKSKRRATRSPTKTRIQGRPRKRKSTLTPEELENLLAC
jgi:hypothetical protein